MRTKTLLLLFLNGFAIVAAFAATEESSGTDPEFERHKGLVYSGGPEELTLDLFLPHHAHPAQPVPCVIVIQGGGFRAQNGQRFRPHAENLAKNGFAAALVAYRGRPNHNYLDTISDIKTAVRFVRKISEEYGLSSDHIGAMGSSAGATLAALLAATGGVEELEGDGEHSEFSSRIQAAVGISGVYDFVARFTSEEQRSLQPNLIEKKKTNGEWIGAPFSPKSEHWLRASAINHIDSEDPPLLLLHSKNDQTVPWLQSLEMHESMTRYGIHSVLETSEQGGHAGPANAKERLVAFFEKTLK